MVLPFSKLPDIPNFLSFETSHFVSAIVGALQFFYCVCRNIFRFGLLCLPVLGALINPLCKEKTRHFQNGVEFGRMDLFFFLMAIINLQRNLIKYFVGLIFKTLRFLFCFVLIELKNNL